MFRLVFFNKRKARQDRSCRAFWLDGGWYGERRIVCAHIKTYIIRYNQIPLLLRIVENTKMNINGIHMHTGSDILDIDVFLYASEILFDILAASPRKN